MRTEPLPRFLLDLADLVAVRLGVETPQLIASTVRDVWCDVDTGKVGVNLAWLDATVKRFDRDKEVAIAVVAGTLAREIQCLAPNGWMFPVEFRLGSAGAVLAIMGVPRDVFERALPALAFYGENDPKGLERARLMRDGYDKPDEGEYPKRTRKRPRRK